PRGFGRQRKGRAVVVVFGFVSEEANELYPVLVGRRRMALLRRLRIVVLFHSMLSFRFLGTVIGSRLRGGTNRFREEKGKSEGVPLGCGRRRGSMQGDVTALRA